jgi:hypothetical protein
MLITKIVSARVRSILKPSYIELGQERVWNSHILIPLHLKSHILIPLHLKNDYGQIRVTRPEQIKETPNSSTLFTRGRES